jgi:polysaccharide biosynthesis protein PslH
VTVRTLFLAVKLPYPTQGGGDLRVWQNVVAACGLGPVAVFGLLREPRRAPPHPAIDRWESSSDPSLTVAPDGPEALQWLADPGASPADSYLSPVSEAEFKRLLDEFQPGVVVMEEVFLHRYMPLLSSCPVVVDDFNVEVVVQSEIARAAGRPHAALIRRRFSDRVARFEAATIAAADRVWVCSAADEATLRARYQPTAPVTVVPSGIDMARYSHARGGLYGLVFPASFGWLPNERAALFLRDELMPLLPGHARLTLCGTNMPAVLRSTADDRVDVVGRVPDIAPYLARAGCLPIPLQEGGGTRLKAVEAFASHLPVVSTAKGIEGLAVEAGRHYLPAETAADFAAALARLDGEPDLLAAITAAAHDHARSRYSWDVASPIVRAELLAAVDARSPTSRLR